MSQRYKKIIKEWNEATPQEVWEGIRDNFTFGFIGATLVVFIATREDPEAKFISFLTLALSSFVK